MALHRPLLPPLPPPLKARRLHPRTPCDSHSAFRKGFCLDCGDRQPNAGSGEDGGGSTKTTEKEEDIRLPFLEEKDPPTPLPLSPNDDDKKLVLVLDLDHTLLNTTWDPIDQLLISYDDDDVGDFHWWDNGSVTKLRPFARRFLAEASEMFKLYIYTMGTRGYAHDIARILDPDGTLFSSPTRVFSREDCTTPGTKCLDVVPEDHRTVLILDDTLSVWDSRNAKNVIPIERYLFFAKDHRRLSAGAGREGLSMSEEGVDEEETDGPLAAALDLLRRVHAAAFDGGPRANNRFSRILAVLCLQKVRRGVLAGCRVVFAGYRRRGVEESAAILDWRMAKRMGAACTTFLDASATHVVSASSRSNAAAWAAMNGKSLVSAEWIRKSYSLWLRLPEEDFPVTGGGGGGGA